MPAKDNNSIATDKARNGFDLDRPEISEIVTSCLSSLLSIIIKENIPRVAKVQINIYKNDALIAS